MNFSCVLDMKPLHVSQKTFYTNLNAKDTTYITLHFEVTQCSIDCISGTQKLLISITHIIVCAFHPIPLNEFKYATRRRNF